MSSGKIVLTGFKGIPIDPQREPVEGDWVTQNNATFQYSPEEEVIEPVVLPVVVLSNPVISESGKGSKSKGDITILTSRTPVLVVVDYTDESDILTQLEQAGEDLELVIMSEKVLKGDPTNAIDDTRFLAIVDTTAKTITIDSTKGFDTSGNWVITEDRVNQGLANIGAPFRVQAELLEFDVISD